MLQHLIRTLTPDRYTPQNLLKVFRDPSLVATELNRIGLDLNRAYHRRRQTDGFAVTDADWDVLVVLDGCRYDLFESCYRQLVADRHVETFRSVRSRGSHSREFLEENFGDGTHHDTVYVSANPFVYRETDEVFHAVENLFRTDWDGGLGTVPPEPVTEATLDALDAYPDKRIVAHYMQPHFPFIGDRGRQLDHRTLHPEDMRELRGENEQPDVDGRTIWDRLKHGEVSRETVWECYRENLELVFSHVAEILDAADGKVVVTSDHGNLLGDRLWPIPVRGYGHPEDIHVGPLLTVPWLSFESERRRTVTADPPESATSIEDTAVEEKLANLGYR